MLHAAAQHSEPAGEVKPATWGFVDERASCDIWPLSAMMVRPSGEWSVGAAIAAAMRVGMRSGHVVGARHRRSSHGWRE